MNPEKVSDLLDELQMKLNALREELIEDLEDEEDDDEEDDDDSEDELPE